MLELLRQLMEAKRSYKKAGLSHLVKMVYATSSKPDKVRLWLFTVLWFACLVLLFVHRSGRLFQDFLIVSTLLWGFNFKLAMRSAFKMYYQSEACSFLLQESGQEVQFLRFLMFRSHLPKELVANSENLNELNELLKNESDLANLSVLSQHPLTLICIGFLTAILGGVSSQPFVWSSGLMWIGASKSPLTR